LRAHHSADQSLVDELARLRQEHNWFYSHLYGHGLNAGAGASVGARAADGAEAAVLEAAIRDREKRIARVLERLALHAYDLEGVAAPPPDAAFFRPALDAHTVLLQYYFRADGGAVFVLSGDRLTAVPLDAGARDVQRLLHRWQLNLDATARALGSGTPLAGLHRNATGILGALYRALLEPVAGALTGRARVIVVPYGPAHAIPWHALYDGRQHLLERCEVVTCPSSSLLRLCAGRQVSVGRDPASALVAAFGGGRLPHVLDEARTVARLFPGECFLEEAATEARLVAAAPRHGILHLAAHGEARLDNPTFAHLQLADGQLTTADVFNLRLDGALVTLSACETGRSVVTGGDELIGLSRGFLFAGASALVQSLWRVEDGSTARLMERFYTALRAGRPKGAALREAQLALLSEGLPAFFWAPFQLVGDAGPLAPPDAASPQEAIHEPDPH
jgi:CHAT domain-containing protein